MAFFLITDKRPEFEESLFANTLQVDSVPDHPNAFDIPAKADRSVIIASSPWAQGAIDAFMGMRADLYAAGKLTYVDANGRHETTYCSYVKSDGKMYFCHKHNEEP
jgi:hypothetical protein